VFEEVEALDSAGVVHEVRKPGIQRRRLSASGRFAVMLAAYLVVAAAVAIGFILVGGLTGDAFGASVGLFGVSLVLLVPGGIASALTLTWLTRDSTRPSPRVGAFTAGALSAAWLAVITGLFAANASQEPNPFDARSVVLLLALFGAMVGTIAGAAAIGLERKSTRDY
jgi:peptidoglycan/LPS O-acetylase OafA/YrhL